MNNTVHHVTPGRGGISRKRAGRGFRYVSANGKRISSAEILARIEALTVPPAWNHVWIASDPHAHIQATGIDDAGRTQYLYHPRWREMRENEKFIRSVAFAQRLTALRRAATRDLKQTDDARARGLGAAVRLMDKAGMRVGGAAYANENGSFGATTLQRRHLHVEGSELHFVFRGKSAGVWDVHLSDELLGAYFSTVPKNPKNGPAICYPVKVAGRKQWRAISDTEVNAYLGRVTGEGFTAKDFRTWQGTVVAAMSLARSARAGITSPEAVTAAIGDAATWLHNTPAVARESYVNPRVIALFEQGKVAALGRKADGAVLDLLTSSD